MTTPTARPAPPSSSWSGGAKLFHWVIALLIFGAILFAILAGHWDELGGTRKQQYWLFMIHKSLGLSVIPLALLRVVWRVFDAPPKPLKTHSPLERKAASTVHRLAYLLLFLLPVTGWWLNSVAGIPLQYFLLFNVPSITEASPALEPVATQTHQILGYVLFAVLAAHIAGALKHHWHDKDSTLLRMLPNGNIGTLTLTALSALIIGIALSLITVELKSEAIAPQIATERPASQMALQSEWGLLPSSTLSFTTEVLGSKVDGHFDRFDADININTETLSLSSISATIYTETITTDNSTRDEMLPDTDWFATTQHPIAQFTAENMKEVEAGQYSADATLSIRGIEKELSFPFTWSETSNKATLLSTLKLHRLDFKLGASEFADSDTIAHDVTVTVNLQLER